MTIQYQLNPENRELKLLRTPRIFALTQNRETGVPYYQIAAIRGEQINIEGMFPKSMFLWFELCYRADINSFYIRRHETRYDEAAGTSFNGVFARNRANASEDGQFKCFKGGSIVASYTVEEINALPTVQSENLVGFSEETRKELLEEARKALYLNKYRVEAVNIQDKRSKEAKAIYTIDPEINNFIAQEVNSFIVGKRGAQVPVPENTEAPAEKTESAPAEEDKEVM